VLTRLDHLVILNPDLGAAVERYTNLGFSVVAGGRHAIGTHNALVTFADGSYLELIAFFERSPDHRWWPALQQGGGFVDFCVGSDDLRGDTERLRRAGVPMQDPRPMSRMRPDGIEVRWELAVPAPGFGGVLPFLIQDVTRRVERVPPAADHPNGIAGIDGVAIAVADLARARQSYERLLEETGAGPDHEARGGGGVRFRLGDQSVTLLAPGGGDDPVARWLAARGPSPYRLTLRSGSRSRRDSWPESETGGVRIELV